MSNVYVKSSRICVVTLINHSPTQCNLPSESKELSLDCSSAMPSPCRCIGCTICTFDPAAFQQAYINFMTTPGNHNDTYASTCHRMFFANYVAGKPPAECPDNDGHNVDAIDVLTLTVPVILRYATAPAAERNQHVRDIIATTRKAPQMYRYAETYSDLLVDVVHGTDLRAAIKKIAGRDIEASISRRDPMVACYMDSSFPALLHFAYKYAEDLWRMQMPVAKTSPVDPLLARSWGLPMAKLNSQHGLAMDSMPKTRSIVKSPRSSNPTIAILAKRAIEAVVSLQFKQVANKLF
ncbi:hypothetical protein AeMF1_018474 [Aphanomyces euteiches]|nr:hypothetical protein AeMF1_018474 [Aphanomyces euteiches]KAH9197499.1 hypothetical protein AeNC1_000505 [Aphanomyces euteiches]